MADALLAVAQRSLTGADTTTACAERRQLVVHVDLETLAHDTAGGCETDGGRAIAPETARRLGCDSALVAIRHRDGRPLSIGRRSRVIPAHLRRALHARDRECRFPGCHQRHHLDAHHLGHWAHGGPTALTNLTLLCHDHTLLHDAATPRDAARSPAHLSTAPTANPSTTSHADHPAIHPPSPTTTPATATPSPPTPQPPTGTATPSTSPSPPN